eukprot:CAMPEP_0173433824 /NCGR_PEP_ID=MMETSP1357-20121228/11118_1 /TAXON_ID=77926 /ORGANISM="Hemiselmis rufescens, Strain PCC563" /LENGTH=564 /DNA_ID=CAMNT_0014398563 /DNA_START=173 /DNA_END=1863 /DNA_ORIENTATION=+
MEYGDLRMQYTEEAQSGSNDPTEPGGGGGGGRIASTAPPPRSQTAEQRKQAEKQMERYKQAERFGRAASKTLAAASDVMTSDAALAEYGAVGGQVESKIQGGGTFQNGMRAVMSAVTSDAALTVVETTGELLSSTILGPIGTVIKTMAQNAKLARYNLEDAQNLMNHAERAYKFVMRLEPKLRSRPYNELKDFLEPLKKIFDEICKMHEVMGQANFLKKVLGLHKDKSKKISQLSEELKMSTDAVARCVQSEQFELQVEANAKIDEMLSKMQSAGPAGLDAKQLAEFAAQAGCKTAQELQGELQGMGYHLSEIQGAVSDALAKLDRMDAKLDQGFAEQRQGFQDLQKGQDAVMLSMQLENTRRAQHDEAQRRFLQDLRAEKGMAVNPVFSDNASLVWLKKIAESPPVNPNDVVVCYDRICMGSGYDPSASTVDGADGRGGEPGRSEPGAAQNARSVGGLGLNGNDGGDGGDGGDGEDGKDLENIGVTIALKEDTADYRLYKVKFQSDGGNHVSGDVGEITFKAPKSASYTAQQEMPKIHIITHGGNGGKGGPGGPGGKGQDGGA